MGKRTFMGGGSDVVLGHVEGEGKESNVWVMGRTGSEGGRRERQKDGGCTTAEEGRLP